MALAFFHPDVRLVVAMLPESSSAVQVTVTTGAGGVMVKSVVPDTGAQITGTLGVHDVRRAQRRPAHRRAGRARGFTERVPGVVGDDRWSRPDRHPADCSCVARVVRRRAGHRGGAELYVLPDAGSDNGRDVAVHDVDRGGIDRHGRACWLGGFGDGVLDSGDHRRALMSCTITLKDLGGLDVVAGIPGRAHDRVVPRVSRLPDAPYVTTGLGSTGRVVGCGDHEGRNRSPGFVASRVMSAGTVRFVGVVSRTITRNVPGSLSLPL